MFILVRSPSLLLVLNGILSGKNKFLPEFNILKNKTPFIKMQKK